MNINKKIHGKLKIVRSMVQQQIVIPAQNSTAPDSTSSNNLYTVSLTQYRQETNLDQ